MNELDLLKTHWQKDNEYIKFKKEDIVKMVHKSSSSIVKWIFIICCLEFIIGLTLSFFSGDKERESNFTEIIYNTLDVIFYIIILCFIYRFYVLLKKITNYSDTKELLQTIIDVRRNADRYIKFNLLLISIIFIAAYVFVIFEKFNDSHSWGERIFFWIFFGVVITLLGLFIRWVMKLYYKLVYGILLKKLTKNYEELIELDK